MRVVLGRYSAGQDFDHNGAGPSRLILDTLRRMDRLSLSDPSIESVPLVSEKDSIFITGRSRRFMSVVQLDRGSTRVCANVA